MPHCSPFYRGCFEGVTCAPRINLISIKWWGTNADLNSQGDKLTINNNSEVKSAKKGGLRLPASPGGISDSNSVWERGSQNWRWCLQHEGMWLLECHDTFTRFLNMPTHQAFCSLVFHAPTCKHAYSMLLMHDGFRPSLSRFKHVWKLRKPSTSCRREATWTRPSVAMFQWWVFVSNLCEMRGHGESPVGKYDYSQLLNVESKASETSHFCTGRGLLNFPRG